MWKFVLKVRLLRFFWTSFLLFSFGNAQAYGDFPNDRGNVLGEQNPSERARVGLSPIFPSANVSKVLTRRAVFVPYGAQSCPLEEIRWTVTTYSNGIVVHETALKKLVAVSAEPKITYGFDWQISSVWEADEGLTNCRGRASWSNEHGRFTLSLGLKKPDEMHILFNQRLSSSFRAWANYDKIKGHFQIILLP